MYLISISSPHYDYTKYCIEEVTYKSVSNLLINEHFLEEFDYLFDYDEPDGGIKSFVINDRGNGDYEVEVTFQYKGIERVSKEHIYLIKTIDIMGK